MNTRPRVTRSRFSPIARPKPPSLTNLTHYEEVVQTTRELKRLTDHFNKEIANVIDRAEHQIKLIKKGDKGDPGPKGDKPTATQLINLIRPLIPKPVKGDPGPKGDKGDDGKSPSIDAVSDSVVAKLAKKIPTVESVAKTVMTVIRPLVEDRLNTMHKEIRHLSSKIAMSSGGGMGNIVPFALAGDGSTTVYTLPQTPTQSGLAIIAHYQGQYLHTGTHFDVSGKQITLTFTPENGTLVEGFLIT